MTAELGTICDSVTLEDIPLSCSIAATYGDGTYLEDYANFESRFPVTRYGRILIDATGTSPGNCTVRDWENGDKALDLRNWVVDHNVAYQRKSAVIYCDRSTIPEVRRLTGDQILGIDYWLWISTLDNSVFGPDQYEHVIWCQNQGVAQTGGHFDRSLIFALPFGTPDDPFHVKPKPAPVAVKPVEASITLTLDGSTWHGTVTKSLPPTGCNAGRVKP